VPLATTALLALAPLLGAGSGGGGGTAPPLWHAVAFVNDPLSHGTLGDGLLSLNEAIRLHNGTLLFTQLSAAEQAQLSLIPGTGTTTDVTWIDIDGSNTPVITIQQDLDPVIDTTFGLLIKGFGDRPVLDFTGPGLTRGLYSPSNALTLQDLVFLGGPYGVDVVQTDVTGQAGAAIDNVRFEQQAGFGVRVTATTTGGVGRLIVQECEFVGVPQAIVHDESGSNRTSIVELHDVVIGGALTGCEFVLGSGGTTRYTLDRVTIDASSSGVRLLRPGQANRPAYLEGPFVRIRAATCATIACSPGGAGTWAVLQAWDLKASPGGTALQLGAPGDALFGELSELSLDGHVTIAAGGASMPLQLYNLRCRGGTASFATSPAQALTLLDSRFDNCAVATAGTGTVVAAGSCFVGGSTAGTAQAPLQLNGCHVASAGPHVQVTQLVPVPQLGSMSIAPEDPPLGGTVQLWCDLPAGCLGVFALGFTDPTPSLLPSLHVYFDPAVWVVLPGVCQLQQSLPWQAPSSPAYAGTDLVVHLVVLAPSGSPAPWLQLPPPRRFVLH
jgi:hypothetical protein